MNPNLDEILQKRKILITCGTGGVGKTTLSAAIAMRAAVLGKKTVVVTIDPAKRLAHSLGLESLNDDPTDLTAKVREKYPEIKGSLAAIVPDTRKTFEKFVRELAPNAALAEKVFQNPIFQIFAKEFSGTNEYMALEKLYSLHEQGIFDCIILDTPPSRNTFAFLDAPGLLSRFFEEKMLRWLLLPTNKLVSVGMKKALGILEKLTGAGFMTHLFEFASALFEVQGQFTTNLKKINVLLESSAVGFTVVTTAKPETAEEIQQFIQNILDHGFHFDGVFLNRTLGYLNCDEPKPGYEKALAVIHALQKREKTLLENLMQNRTPVCAKIPELARDVHSVEDLFHVATALGDNSSHHS